jgi:hypothetical protein
MGRDSTRGLGSLQGVEPMTRKPGLATAVDQPRTTLVLYERAPR